MNFDIYVKNKLEGIFGLKFDVFYDKQGDPLMCETIGKEYIFWFPTEEDPKYRLYFEGWSGGEKTVSGKEFTTCLENFIDALNKRLDKDQNKIKKAKERLNLLE